MKDFMSSMENPIISVTYSSGAAQDSCDDSCSICLESFNSEEPATVTKCNHEYHLQCILEWSQRSKECPICWQLLILKDPASQELLAAVEIERKSRTRNRYTSGSNTSTFPRIAREDTEIENSAVPPFINDSEFDDHIMQQIAAAAMGRARYFNRRERQRSSRLGPSQVIVFASPANEFNAEQTYITSPIEGENLGSLSMENYSSAATMSSAINDHPPSSPLPSWVNTSGSNNAGSGPGPIRSGILPDHSPPDSPQRSRSHELLSLSESFKSRLSAASARYKESFSKSTRGFKEKLLARNNSVKELSKEVQREVSAGFSGVVRMMERLDPKSKRTGDLVPVSSGVGETADLSCDGKSAQENLIAQSQNRNHHEIAHGTNSNASLHVSGSRSSVPAHLKVSRAQDVL